MKEKEIIIRLSPEAVKSLLPHTEKISVVQIYVGKQEQYYSTTAPITGTIIGSQGHISGGGTQVNKYYSYDFGFDVENTSNAEASFRFTFETIDADGCQLADRKRVVELVIGSNEKKRVWAGFQVSQESDFSLKDFKSYLLTEVQIISLFQSGVPQKIFPKKTIYEIFEPQLKQFQKQQKYDLLIALLGLWSFLGGVTAIPTILLAWKFPPTTTKAKFGYFMAKLVCLFWAILLGLAILSALFRR